MLVLGVLGFWGGFFAGLSQDKRGLTGGGGGGGVLMLIMCMEFALKH